MAVEEQSQPEHTLAPHQVRVVVTFMMLSHLPVFSKYGFWQSVMLPPQRNDSVQQAHPAVLLVLSQYR